MSEPTPNPAPPIVPETTITEGDKPEGPSKGELKKRAKEAEKAKKQAERQAREEEERTKREALNSIDNAVENYGKLPLHQSQSREGKERLRFENVGKDSRGERVVFRARLHNLRPQGVWYPLSLQSRFVELDVDEAKTILTRGG